VLSVGCKLASSPFYLTARFSAGYALVLACCGAGKLDFGFVVPELGLKWVIRKRGNVGVDLLSLPIAFGTDDSHVQIVPISYRALFYGGVNF
jgi:hypothetical protein